MFRYFVLCSDTIEIWYTDPKDRQLKRVDLLRTGIAWDSDKKYKFKNPTLSSNQSLEDGNFEFLTIIRLLLSENVCYVHEFVLVPC